MRVYLSTQNYDLFGHVIIDALASSDFGEVSRRTSVVATLDGGVAVNDGGASEGDRTIVLTWKTKSKTYEDNIKRIIRLYGRLHLSTDEGFYVVVPTPYRQAEAESSLTLRVIEKVS